MKGVIVSGTDTGIGKTVVAAGLTGALGATYWKPVQSGLEDETDSEAVARLVPGARILPEVYRLVTPCSPHEAARIDGVEIDVEKLRLPDVDGPVVVEGAGGAMVPYADDLLAADLFADLGMPAVVVARTMLGTISHTLMTLEVLRARGVPVAGVIFVGEAELVAESAIQRFGAVAHLGRLPHLDPLGASALRDAFAANIRLDALR
ncbi:dethiobiotin synthase [Aurantiacibacter aquimixticola]|uniref:ATP-dependent dethiobiotin synthetase BioD n=1 Tax=Aurantiacibacter aquimixticola TaxID=1958945 RepID=A0A419RWA5_9SPHN|nr:dethiobiotin synthase [Aurantiacibacter aquimixticola]RJY10066.1 ATP-dependent dethiobiotin synthetase BioD [Aurantiacibacter aquimixticola]